MNANKFYVYGLVDCENNVFYIGKGIKNRWKRHYSPSSILKDSNRHKINKILKTRNILGYDPEPIIFESNISEQQALLIESTLIKKYRDIIVNITEGGNQPPVPVEWLEHIKKHGLTEEHKRKISQSKKEKKLSPEHREKASKNLMKKGTTWEEHYGEKGAAELRKMFSLKWKNVSYEERYGPEKAKELREMRSRTLKGKSKSADHKAALSKAKKAKRITKYGITPEIEEEIRENNTGEKSYRKYIMEKYNIGYTLYDRIIKGL